MPKLVDHAERRDRVATLAQEVIRERGLASLTLRDVAGRGGWSPTAVTHYFRTRDELLVYTLQHSRCQVDDRITAAIESGSRPLQAIIEQTLPLDAERTNRWQVWLAFWGSAVGSASLGEVQHKAQHAFRQQIAECLVESDFEGDAQSESGRLVALIDGVAIQTLFAPDDWPAERQLAQFTNHLPPSNDPTED